MGSLTDKQLRALWTRYWGQFSISPRSLKGRAIEIQTVPSKNLIIVVRTNPGVWTTTAQGRVTKEEYYHVSIRQAIKNEAGPGYHLASAGSRSFGGKPKSPKARDEARQEALAWAKAEAAKYRRGVYS